MRVIAAFDSFKGCLSAVEACEAVRTGLARILPQPEVIACPLSDGGEGFAEALFLAAEGRRECVTVTGPLGNEIAASLVFVDGGKTAIVESAQACGLGLIPKDRRNPGQASTAGVGELIKTAQDMGAERVVAGLGGSGTNDGGIGLLSAWGWKFLDAQGRMLVPVGDSLDQIDKIIEGARPEIPVVAACDVRNPLHGPTGAAYVYARQKGASEADIERLDKGLAHYGRKVADFLGDDFAVKAGAGAAGGLGFALLAFFHAEFKPGAELVLGLAGIPEKLAKADLCLTGEGGTDSQTLNGKLPAAVINACVAAMTPCVCLSGSLGTGWRELYKSGCAGVFSISQKPQTLEGALAGASDNLADAAEGVMRVFCASKLAR